MEEYSIYNVLLEYNILNYHVLDILLLRHYRAHITIILSHSSLLRYQLIINIILSFKL